MQVYVWMMGCIVEKAFREVEILMSFFFLLRLSTKVDCRLAMRLMSDE